MGRLKISGILATSRSSRGRTGSRLRVTDSAIRQLS